MTQNQIDFSGKKILLIDGLNAFTRNFAAYPQLDKNGLSIGGVVGTLKTLKKLIMLTGCNLVVFCWEGGGSSRRRSLYSDYKATRKPEKLNRFYEDDIPETEENRNRQVKLLVSLMQHLPVCQLYVEDAEADDLIGYLCSHKFKDNEKIIVSSDKDFYQLIDEKTTIYNLHKKQFLDEKYILDNFQITPQNFALAKTLCGDVSDNIKGVKGLGFKTVAKKFPMLSLKDSFLLEDLISYSSVRIKESQLYKRVVESEELIKLNWRLVYLNGTMLSAQQISKIDSRLDAWKPNLNKISFTKQLISFYNPDFDIDTFIYPFNSLLS